ncbi:dynein light chain 1, cytoplasmic protein [Ceratobasidium sp. AG-Ba]|nr:dynein light chain 1, cytoplasmic protein [Ceratobasidium sp. AG-Ba]
MGQWCQKRQAQRRKGWICSTANAGSFLRPNTPGIVTGTDFITVLLKKYVDEQRTNGQESVILGSSNGAIVVEAPRLDGVRARISQVEKLRGISLDECDVSTPGDLESIKKMSVQSLNLSRTLFGSWEDVMDIIGQMPKLTSLELNFNRLRFTRPSETREFTKLTRLELNSAMISWVEACGQPHSVDVVAPNLKTLNLDSNVLDDWVSVMRTCSALPSLHSLMLPSNLINSISRWSEADPRTSPLSRLQHLSLADNPIASWEAVDSLATWLPNLKILSISLESLRIGSSSSASRDFVIARLPQLARLNGSQVTERDRADAELFYLSWISKHESGTELEIEARHPRWKELSHKHQTSSEPVKPVVQNLGSNIITVNIIRFQGPISRAHAVKFTPPSHELKVLPSMSTKVFAMKIKKSMKIQTQIGPESLWMVSPAGPEQVLPLRQFDGDVLREIAWSGVEDGCYVGLIES